MTSSSFSLNPAILRLAESCGRQVETIGRRYRIFRADLSSVVIEREGLYWYGIGERNDGPYFDWSSTDLTTVERRLVMDLGNSFRDQSSLMSIEFPFHAEDIAPGFILCESRPGWHTLRRTNGALLPLEVHEEYAPTLWSSVEFSYVVDAPLDQLAASYLDPDGAPLLTEFVTHP